MRRLLHLLATHKRLWIPPILLYFAVIAVLANESAVAPTNPFEYRLD